MEAPSIIPPQAAEENPNAMAKFLQEESRLFETHIKSLRDLFKAAIDQIFSHKYFDMAIWVGGQSNLITFLYKIAIKTDKRSLSVFTTLEENPHLLIKIKIEGGLNEKIRTIKIQNLDKIELTHIKWPTGVTATKQRECLDDDQNRVINACIDIFYQFRVSLLALLKQRLSKFLENNDKAFQNYRATLTNSLPPPFDFASKEEYSFSIEGEPLFTEENFSNVFFELRKKRYIQNQAFDLFSIYRGLNPEKWEEFKIRIFEEAKILFNDCIQKEARKKRKILNAFVTFQSAIFMEVGKLLKDYNVIKHEKIKKQPAAVCSSYIQHVENEISIHYEMIFLSEEKLKIIKEIENKKKKLEQLKACVETTRMSTSAPLPSQSPETSQEHFQLLEEYNQLKKSLEENIKKTARLQVRKEREQIRADLFAQEISIYSEAPSSLDVTNPKVDQARGMTEETFLHLALQQIGCKVFYNRAAIDAEKTYEEITCLVAKYGHLLFNLIFPGQSFPLESLDLQALMRGVKKQPSNLLGHLRSEFVRSQASQYLTKGEFLVLIYHEKIYQILKNKTPLDAQQLSYVQELMEEQAHHLYPNENDKYTQIEKMFQKEQEILLSLAAKLIAIVATSQSEGPECLWRKPLDITRDANQNQKIVEEIHLEESAQMTLSYKGGLFDPLAFQIRLGRGARLNASIKGSISFIAKQIYLEQDSQIVIAAEKIFHFIAEEIHLERGAQLNASVSDSISFIAKRIHLEQGSKMIVAAERIAHFIAKVIHLERGAEFKVLSSGPPIPLIAKKINLEEGSHMTIAAERAPHSIANIRLEKRARFSVRASQKASSQKPSSSFRNSTLNLINRPDLSLYPTLSPVIERLFLQADEYLSSQSSTIKGIFELAKAYKLCEQLKLYKGIYFDIKKRLEAELTKIEKGLKSSSGNLLHFFARLGDVNIFFYLFSERKYSCEVINKPVTLSKKGTPLCIAAACGHADIVDVLLAQGADITIKMDCKEYSRTALHIAVEKGYEQIVQLLLDQPNIQEIIDSEQSEELGKYTALHLAAKKGYFSIFKMLSKKGADLWKQDALGRSVAEILIIETECAECDKLDRKIVSLLKKRTPDFYADASRFENCLIHAISKGLIETVKKMLSGKDVPIFQKEERNFLEIATNAAFQKTSKRQKNSEDFATEKRKKNCIEMIYWLIEEKNISPIEKFKQDDSYLIHRAALEDCYPLVHFLIKRKTDFQNLLDRDDNTPLHFACFSKEDRVEIVQALMDGYPALLKNSNRQNQLPLHVAAYSGNSNIVHLLLQNPLVREQINARDDLGNTPLHLAVICSGLKFPNKRSQDYQKVADELLIYGANKNLENKVGEKPLDVALKSGDQLVMKTLNACHLLEAVQNDVKEFYKTFYKVHQNKAVDSDLQGIPIEEYFMLKETRETQALKGLIGPFQSAGNKEKSFILPSKLFEASFGKPSYRLWVVGKPGIGKSRLCAYLTYLWAEKGLWKEKFDLIIKIKLGNLTRERYEQDPSLGNIIVTECLGKEWKLRKKEIIALLEQMASPRILYILDGYGEFPKDSPCRQEIERLLLKKDYNLILTSRRTIHASIKFDDCLECVGLTPKNIHGYISAQFDSKKAGLKEGLMQFLSRHPAISDLARVPVILKLLCETWEKPHSDDIESMTTLYVKVFLKLLKKEEEDKQQSIQSLLRRLAFQTLEKGQSTFASTLVSKKGESRYEEVPPIAVMEKSPHDLLSYISELEPKFLNCHENYEGTSYSFCHLSTQEYWAASYLAEALVNNRKILMYNEETKEEEETTLENFIALNKYNSKYRTVFLFIVGILEPKHPIALRQFFDYLVAAPRDLIGCYEDCLFIRCIEQALIFSQDLKGFKKEIPQQEALLQNFRMRYLDSKKGLHWFLEMMEISRDVAGYIGVERKNLLIEDDESSPQIGKWSSTKESKENATSIQEVKYITLEKTHGLCLLCKDKEKNMRFHAATVLGEIAKTGYHLAEEAIDELIQLLFDQESSVQEAAGLALSQIGKLGQRFSQKTFFELKKAVRSNRISTRASALLVCEALIQARYSLPIETIAEIAIAMHDESVVEKIYENSVVIRLSALNFLKKVITINKHLPDELIYGLIKVALEDKEGSLCVFAAELLGEIDLTQYLRLIELKKEFQEDIIAKIFAATPLTSILEVTNLSEEAISYLVVDRLVRINSALYLYEGKLCYWENRFLYSISIASLPSTLLETLQNEVAKQTGIQRYLDYSHSKLFGIEESQQEKVQLFNESEGKQKEIPFYQSASQALVNALNSVANSSNDSITCLPFIKWIYERDTSPLGLSKELKILVCGNCENEEKESRIKGLENMLVEKIPPPHLQSRSLNAHSLQSFNSLTYS